MARLTISLDPAVIRALKKDHDLTLVVSAREAATMPSGKPVAKKGRPGRPAGSKPAAASGAAGPYRPGSLPARVLEWSQTRKRPFGTEAVLKKFKMKRAHASMILSKLSKEGHLDRPARGKYVRIV